MDEAAGQQPGRGRPWSGAGQFKKECERVSLIPHIRVEWTGWNVCLVGWIYSRIIGDPFLELFVGGLEITLSWPNSGKWIKAYLGRKRAARAVKQ